MSGPRRETRSEWPTRRRPRRATACRTRTFRRFHAARRRTTRQVRPVSARRETKVHPCTAVPQPCSPGRAGLPRTSPLFAWTGMVVQSLDDRRPDAPIILAVLKTKSVYSPASENDGLRILATRFRGRGMSSNLYDVWMPSLGPSEQLLRAVQSGKITWAAFTRDFKKELFLDGSIDARNKTIKNHGQKSALRLIKAMAREGNVTLMCHCDEDA